MDLKSRKKKHESFFIKKERLFKYLPDVGKIVDPNIY